MSFSETIFLFLLALIIFGPKKLPEIARMVGKTLNEFRRASNEFKMQIEQEIAHLDVQKNEIEKKQAILPPAAPPENTASRSLNAAPAEVPSGSNSDPSVSGLAAANSADSGAVSGEDEPLFATEASAGAAPDLHVPPVATEAIAPADATSPSSQSSAPQSSAAQESHA